VAGLAVAWLTAVAATVSFAVSSTVSAVTSVSLKSPSAGRMDVSYAPVAGAASYEVVFTGRTTAGTPLVTTYAPNGTATSKSMTGLPGGTYAVKVRARDSGSNIISTSAEASLSIASMLDTSLAVPTAPTLSAPTPTQLTVSWPSVAGVSRYDMHYTGTTATGTSVARVVPSIWATARTIPLPAGTCTFRVRSVSSTATSTWSYQKSFTLLAAPAKPTVSSPAPGSMTASWGTVAGATGYQVQYSGTTSTGSPIAAVSLTSTTNTISVANLAAGTYSVKVAATSTASATASTGPWSANTTVSVAPPSTSPSGQPMPVGNLNGWRQVFTDDFTTDVPLGSFPAAVSSKWSAYPSPWRDSSKNGMYAPTKVVSISGGVLNKYIHTDANGQPLVAALLPKVPGSSKYGQDYGRYAVRFRADKLDGYKMAWLLWPDSEVWPRDGEIDFPEKNFASSTVEGFVHRQGATSGSDQYATKAPMDINQWHTTVIEWSPNLVRFLLDGVEIGRTTERIPNTAMHWVIQTETMITSVMPSPAVAGNVQIDWVAAWQYDPTATAGS
jgi:hypothetical protein